MKYKICYLGLGAWGYCLARLLASKGYDVCSWSRNKKLVDTLLLEKEHPKLPGYPPPKSLSFTTDLQKALNKADLIVESVTSSGLRSLCENIKDIKIPSIPFTLTSKGIEQNTGLLLSNVVLEVFGDKMKKYITYLSGPSIAKEVIQGLPCSVVCSAYDSTSLDFVRSIFHTPTFRIYPNFDMIGVELGGAMKNVIAIACGISDGLNFGDNAKAGLITRGLHEMRRLAIIKGSRPDTLNGLAGMGDLCVTCFSKFSRNYQCGRLIAEGYSLQEAKNQINMVIEGAYTTVSAMQIAHKHQIELPITEGIYKVFYENLSPLEGVHMLLKRTIKEEYL